MTDWSLNDSSYIFFLLCLCQGKGVYSFLTGKLSVNFVCGVDAFYYESKRHTPADCTNVLCSTPTS